MTAGNREIQSWKTDSDDVGPVVRICFLSSSAIVLLLQLSVFTSVRAFPTISACKIEGNTALDMRAFFIWVSTITWSMSAFAMNPSENAGELQKFFGNSLS